MSIETVVGDIHFRAQEPFSERSIRPVADLRPLLEPVEMISLFRPEFVRIFRCGSAEVLILLHRLDRSVFAELFWRSDLLVLFHRRQASGLESRETIVRQGACAGKNKRRAVSAPQAKCEASDLDVRFEEVEVLVGFARQLSE